MENALKCNVCLAFYDSDTHKPRLLPTCGHTVCEFCIRNLLSLASSRSCPQCRKPNALSSQINNLPVNYNLLQVIENYEKPNSRSSLPGNENKGQEKNEAKKAGSSFPLQQRLFARGTGIQQGMRRSTVQVNPSQLHDETSSSAITPQIRTVPCSPLDQSHLMTNSHSNLSIPSDSSAFQNVSVWHRNRQPGFPPSDISLNGIVGLVQDQNIIRPQPQYGFWEGLCRGFSSSSQNENHTMSCNQNQSLVASDNIVAQKLQEEIDFQMAVHLTFCKDSSHCHDELLPGTAWQYPEDEDLKLALQLSKN